MTLSEELKNIFLRKPKFFYGFISMYYPLSEKHIALLKNDLFWELISLNEYIHFTISLVKKFSSLLNKEDLSYNKSINKDKSLLDYLGNKHTIALQQEYMEYEAMRNKPATDSDYHPNIRYHKLTPLEVEKNIELIDWKHFSSNQLINWNKQILYKYKDFFWFGVNISEDKYTSDGLELYNNEAVPWDIEILMLFEDEILTHKGVISQFLHNRTMVKNIKPLLTNDFVSEIISRLKF